MDPDIHEADSSEKIFYLKICSTEAERAYMHSFFFIAMRRVSKKK